MTEVWHAHAKVNLGLRITGRRADGYHTIDSLFVSVDLHDIVTVVPAGDASLTITGPSAEGVATGAGNLARRAATSAGAPLAAITIDKHIPAGAGLGGASADAAAVLHALGRGRDLVLGAVLGADVPFCMTGGAARVTGVGDVLTATDVPADLWMVLVVPSGIACSTTEIYAEWDRAGPGRPQPVDVPGIGPVVNDLTGAALRLSPGLDAAATALERVTRRPWLLTGSGSGLVLPLDDGELAADVARRVDGRVLRPVAAGVTLAS